MSSTAWDEIKRLAADFQRAQLASTTQKLSERNIIEIVARLEKLGLLSVHHTSDGRTYITPEHLTREIEDELVVRGGRADFSSLAKALKVDILLVERRAKALAKTRRDVHLVSSQLLTNDYLDAICEEVNERLQLSGSLHLAELVKKYDLPAEFISKVMVERLGRVILGRQDDEDPGLFFTESFIARHQATVRGVLLAITRPTKVSAIVAQHQFQEKLFFSLADKLISKGQVGGMLTGNKRLQSAMFLPHIYSRAQREWVDNFWKQNGYLEFEALRRLDINDPEGYIKRRFADESVTFLGDVCVGPGLVDQVAASVNEALLTGGWVDVYPILPSIFSPEAGGGLVQQVLRDRQDRKSSAAAHLLCDTIVVSGQLVTAIKSHLQELMPPRAKQAVEQGAFKQQIEGGAARDEDSGRNKKDERRKKATGGKHGGGTQGRETKTKAVKNKHKNRRQQDSDSDDDSSSSARPTKMPLVPFLSMDELKDEIAGRGELDDCPEELVDALASELHHELTVQFQEVAKTVFLAASSAGSEGRKKTHQQLLDKVAALLTSIRLAEKGAKVFDADTQAQLKKHLLRTQCSEVLNELILYLAQDNHIQVNKDKEVAPEVRLKIIQKLPDEAREPMMAAHKALAGQEIDEFNDVIDDAVAAAGLMMKKKDNKKDRQVLANHRHALLEQLDGSLDAPLTLHLASLALFQASTGHMLHASGKFVPLILAHVRDAMAQDAFTLLQEYQELVIKSLSRKGDEDNLGAINLRLEELTPKVKEIAVTFRKTTSTSQE